MAERFVLPGVITFVSAPALFKSGPYTMLADVSGVVIRPSHEA
jgi:hypothetical protein